MKVRKIHQLVLHKRWKDIFFHQSFLNGFNFGDDDWKTNDIIIERGNDFLQLTFDVDGLNRNARTPEIASMKILI